jgi:hypothetical protein
VRRFYFSKLHAACEFLYSRKWKWEKADSRLSPCQRLMVIGRNGSKCNESCYYTNPTFTIIVGSGVRRKFVQTLANYLSTLACIMWCRPHLKLSRYDGRSIQERDGSVTWRRRHYCLHPSPRNLCAIDSNCPPSNISKYDTGFSTVRHCRHGRHGRRVETV